MTMLKKILTYGATLAVTVGLFTTFLNSPSANQSYKKEHDDDNRTFKVSGLTKPSQQQAIDALLEKKGGHIIKIEQEGKHKLGVKGIDAQGNRYEVYITL
jgi:hypothetical protein